MSIIKPRTMPGVMELLPLEQAAFQAFMDTIRKGFECHGYLPIETPVMEFTDVLLSKTGGDTEKQVYFAQSTGSRQQGQEPELALRFDLTVPLARYVGEHEGQLVFPFRRYQMQRSYRGEAPQRGRYREFYQCDIDIIGRENLDLGFDAEIPAVIHAVFQALNIGAFTIQFNNRKLLLGLLEGLGIEGIERQALVLREIDKGDKVGPKGVRAALLRLSLDNDTTDAIMNFVAIDGVPSTVLAALEKWPNPHPLFVEGLGELRQVTNWVKGFGVPETDFAINLSIARGLDYYTGTIYETRLDAHPELGSICSGGRYDDLASHYTKSRLPGVGASIGATRLFYKLRELGLVGEGNASIQVLVTQLDPELRSHYLQFATQLRRAGIATDLWMQKGRFKKQMKYANRLSIPLVLIMGEDELSAGVVTLKLMDTGEQRRVSIDDLVGSATAMLAER